MKAQWSKIKKTDEWGARVFHEHPFDSVAPGDKIVITSQKGEATDAVVKEVVWSGEDDRAGTTVTLCSIERT